MKEYSINLLGTTQVYASLHVEAENEQEAREKVLRPMYQRWSDWTICEYDNGRGLNIVNLEIESIREYRKR